MLENEETPTREPGFVVKLLLGLFLGAVAGILIPVVVFMFVVPGLGSGAGKTRFAVAEILDLAMLGGSGYLAYQAMAHSALARGLMIGISIAFLLNAICGVVIMTVR